MKNQGAILRGGFTLFSVISSFAFVFFAVSVITGEGATQWMNALAYVAGGYGLANIYILSWAWRNQAAWALWANKFFALCFLGVLLVDTLSQGIENLTQVLVLLGLACVLTINWYALKQWCQRQDT